MMWSEKFNKALIEMQKCGDVYAEAKSQSWFLQEMCSVMKSSLIEKALSENPKLSQVRAECVARSSKEYIVHLDGTKVAIELELKSKCRYEKAVNTFEACRSLVSLDKKLEGKSGSEKENQ